MNRAYTVCTTATCTELVEVGRGKCDACAPPPWVQPSQHTMHRPSDWGARKTAAMRRDGGRCVARLDDGSRCPRKARVVDHVVPVAEGGDWELPNLQSLCDPHDADKTENDLARMRMRNARSHR